MLGDFDEVDILGDFDEIYTVHDRKLLHIINKSITQQKNAKGWINQHSTRS